jgi:hypothetical protein
VRVCVLGPDGAPARGVTLGGTTWSGVGRPAAPLEEAECALDERFTAGTWLLTLRGAGDDLLRLRVELPPGGLLDLGRVSLASGTPVLVRVVDAQGAAAAGVGLTLIPEDLAPGEAGARMSTDPSGSARFPAVPAGRPTVLLSDARYARTGQLVQAAETGSAPHVLVARPGTGIALDFGPSAAQVRRALVHDAGGELVALEDVPWSGLVALRLAPGEYVVELEGAPTAQRIRVDARPAVYDVR